MGCEIGRVLIVCLDCVLYVEAFNFGSIIMNIVNLFMERFGQRTVEAYFDGSPSVTCAFRFFNYTLRLALVLKSLLEIKFHLLKPKVFFFFFLI